MKLYVCFTTSGPDFHGCAKAYRALDAAGWKPEVIKSYGSRMLPDFANRTRGRRDVRELTGQKAVPVLVTDSGEAIYDSAKIVEWASANPAGSPSA